MANFWGGFGQGFSGGFETGWTQAARRRELREAAQKEKDALAAEVIALQTAAKRYGGDLGDIVPQSLTDRTMGLKHKLGYEGDIIKAPYTDTDLMLSDPTVQQMLPHAERKELLAMKASGKASTESMKLDSKRLEELGASLANPAKDFGVPPAILSNYSKKQQEFINRGANSARDKAYAPFLAQAAANKMESIQVQFDLGRYTGNPVSEKDVGQFLENLPQNEQILWMSDKNLEELKKRRDVLAEYNSNFKEPFVLPYSNIAKAASLQLQVAKTMEKMSEVKKGSDEYSRLDKKLEQDKIDLSKSMNKTYVNYKEIESLNKAFDKLSEKGDAQKKLVWDTKARAAIARVEEFKKLIDSDVFEGGEEGSFDDRESLYRTTYFKEVKDPDTGEGYTDVNPAFYPWLNTFNVRVPSPPAAGLGPVINIGTGGRQESIVYLPEGVATDAKGLKPPEGEVEDSETVLFKRERRESNMTKAQKDIIDIAREGRKLKEGEALAILRDKRLIRDETGKDAEVVDITRLDDEDKGRVLNQKEGVLFRGDDGDEFIRIGNRIYELK